MATKKTSIFDRAAEALETGTSAQCQALIAELRDLEQTESAEAALIRPPGERVIGGDGRTYATLPTGDTYAEAAAAGKSTHELEARFHAIEARLEQARVLADRLEHRRQQAEQQERFTAAPEKAEAAIEALGALCDEHQAAAEVFAEVHGRLKETFSTLLEARKLNPDAPGLSVEQFARIGRSLSFTIPAPRQVRDDHNFSKPPTIRYPLFGDAGAAIANARALVAVPQSVWERTAALLKGLRSNAIGHEADRSDTAVRRRLDDWYRGLVEVLEAGDVERAKALPAPEYKHGQARFDSEVA